MLVSVVIPTFNREDVLFRAIESVLKQDYRNFELIIIDDGSTDKTEELVQTYIKENGLGSIMFYTQIENQGVSAARNIGIKQSKGEWVAFLDSDDEWLPDKLSRQVEFSKQYPELPLIHGEEIWVRRGKRVNPKKKHAKSGGNIFLRCLELCLISPSAVMIKKELLNELGGFNEKFPVCEDYDLWLRITSKHEVGFIKDPIIIKYGGHEDQLSQKFKAMDYWRVKSLCSLMAGQELSEDYLAATLGEMIKKGQVLIHGFEKHEHHRLFREMTQAMEFASSFITNTKQ